jgi:hypothetical protein
MGRQAVDWFGAVGEAGIEIRLDARVDGAEARPGEFVL